MGEPSRNAYHRHVARVSSGERRVLVHQPANRESYRGSATAKQRDTSSVLAALLWFGIGTLMFILVGMGILIAASASSTSNLEDRQAAQRRLDGQ
jgi:hypothetical protein